MAQRIFRVHGDERVRTPVIGGNSETFAEDSLVSKNSSGFLIVSTAGLRVWGICKQTVTMSSTNQTVAQVTPICIEAINVDMSMLGDQAEAQSNLFNYADISTVSAGLQTVALSTADGTTRQLSVQGKQSDFDGSPPFVGDTTQIIVRVARMQDLSYA